MRRMRFTVTITVVLSVLFVAGCSGDASVRQSIGPSGGMLVLPGNRGSVSIPAAALASATEIGVTEVAASTLPALPEGAVAVGPYVAFTPHGTAFEVPATVELTYESAETGLTVMRIDSPSDTSWEALPEAVISRGRARVETGHFSVFVVTAYTIPCGTSGSACCMSGFLSEADDPDGDGCIGAAAILSCRAEHCGAPEATPDAGGTDGGA